MACRNAGYELVYNSLHRGEEQIVSTTIHEALSIVGLSYLFVVHVHLFSRALKLIRERVQTALQFLVAASYLGKMFPHLDEGII